MDTAISVSHGIRKILRWIEWFLIAHCIVRTLTSVAFEPGVVTYLQLGLFVGSIAALSFFFPANRPLWQRRGYIGIEMLVLLLTITLPINTFLFFELFVLKACFLLSRRDVIVGTAITASLFLTQIMWQLPQLIEESRVNSAAYLDQPGQIAFDIFVEYLVGCTFVVLFGVVFASEQRSRLRAERLAGEVEALATKLERTRIARDIHDSLGHSLTTLDVQIALAQRYSQLESQPLTQHQPLLHICSPTMGHPPRTAQLEVGQLETGQPAVGQANNNRIKLKQSLNAAQQLVTQCLAEARQSLHTMRESSFCLDDALQTLVEQMRQSFRVKLKVQLPELPQQLNYQLYLIAKEGLRNVQKHAQATQVSLTLTAVGQQVILTLVDDGCGFELANVNSGYGLQGMQERSQLLGGQLTVNSQLQKGTRLRVTVPVDPAAIKTARSAQPTPAGAPKLVLGTQGGSLIASQ
ncbi:MAG: sensor histidine kinase [Cyanobacteria bacterium J06623_4]